MSRSAPWHAALAAKSLVALVALSTGCEKKADSAKGHDLYVTTCARCHSTEGTGGLPVFAGGPSPRNFRDHAFHRDRTDEQIKQTIVNGKGTAMPAFGTTFNDAELTALVAYVRSFDTDKGKP